MFDCTVLSWCPVCADLSWKCISSTVSWSAKTLHSEQLKLVKAEMNKKKFLQMFLWLFKVHNVPMVQKRTNLREIK